MIPVLGEMYFSYVQKILLNSKGSSSSNLTFLRDEESNEAAEVLQILMSVEKDNDDVNGNYSLFSKYSLNNFFSSTISPKKDENFLSLLIITISEMSKAILSLRIPSYSYLLFFILSTGMLLHLCHNNKISKQKEEGSNRMEMILPRENAILRILIDCNILDVIYSVLIEYSSFLSSISLHPLENHYFFIHNLQGISIGMNL
jgi:hypothetical protein